MEGRGAGHMGFVLTCRLGGEVSDGHAVGPSPFGKGGQTGDLVGDCGYHDLAATVVGHFVLGAELHHPVSAAHG